jgi:hypothetical protein
MVVLGIVLLILGLLGVARALLVPLGTILLILGIVIDLLHVVFHTGALIF